MNEKILTEYSYGMRKNHFGIGHQPTEGFIERCDTPGTYCEFDEYGRMHVRSYLDKVVYSRPLSKEETEKYGLDYFGRKHVAYLDESENACMERFETLIAMNEVIGWYTDHKFDDDMKEIAFNEPNDFANHCGSFIRRMNDMKHTDATIIVAGEPYTGRD